MGRAVATVFAKEGADVAIVYLAEMEDDDALHTAELVREAGRRCELIKGDLASEEFCDCAVAFAVDSLGGLDVVVNHAGTQAVESELTELSTEQFDRTFKVNVYIVFWMTRAALKHMIDGGSVVNTGSVNGLRGNKSMMDYAASKSAVHTAGGTGRTVQAGMKVCWADSEQAGVEQARKWANETLPGPLAVNLPTPKDFRQAVGLVGDDAVRESFACGPDAERHIREVQAFDEAGVDELYVQQIGPEQEKFFEAWQQDVLPHFHG